MLTDLQVEEIRELATVGAMYSPTKFLQAANRIPALLADREEMLKLLREAVRYLNRTECAGCDEEGNCDDPLCEEIDAFLSSPAVQELVK